MATPVPYAGPVRAPEFPPEVAWVGGDTRTLRGLRGKFVALDFWTYG